MNSIHVNGTEISPEEVYAEMQYFPSDSVQQAQQAAINSLVLKVLICQKAQDLGLEAADSDELIELVLDQEVQVAEPTDEECQRFYHSHPEDFSSSPLVEARHILLSAAPDDAKVRSERLDQAQALIKRLLENPHEFAKLAEKFSDCPSKTTGGSLGQVSKGQTVAEFEKALFRAEAGLMTSPVESRYGVHVVWVERSVPGQPLPYEMVAENIRKYLGERAERQAVSDYLRRLTDDADIKGVEMETTPLIQ